MHARLSTSADVRCRVFLLLQLVSLLAVSVAPGADANGSRSPQRRIIKSQRSNSPSRTSPASKPKDDLPSYLRETFEFQRPRVGLFTRSNDISDSWFTMYEDYFKKVTKMREPELDKISVNDWRNYRPTSKMCLDFLGRFQSQGYNLFYPFEIIIMDACLDWLYADDVSDKKAIDLRYMSEYNKKNMNLLRESKRMRQIYDDYKLDRPDVVSAELREEMYDYLMALLAVYEENPKQECHGDWLTAYLEFFEGFYFKNCPSDADEEDCLPFDEAPALQDSYLNLITESTRQAGRRCYNIMHGHLLETIREEKRGGLSVMIRGGSLDSQMRDIMRVVLNAKKKESVSVADASQRLALIKRATHETDYEIQGAINQLTDSLSEFALEQVKKLSTSKDAQNSDSRAKYGQVMTNLCGQFVFKNEFFTDTSGVDVMSADDDDDQVGHRSKKKEKKFFNKLMNIMSDKAKRHAAEGDGDVKAFDFYNIVYSLIKVTNHPVIFGVTKEEFEEHVRQYHWEEVYLSTFACQLISMTNGELSYETNRPKFAVRLNMERLEAIDDWPLSDEFVVTMSVLHPSYTFEHVLENNLLDGALHRDNRPQTRRRKYTKEETQDAVNEFLKKKQLIAEKQRQMLAQRQSQQPRT